MKKLAILFGFLVGLGLSFNSFSNVTDGVKPLSTSTEPTEAQIQAVRDGAKNACEDKEDDNAKQECVADYYANHNLEEEPSCD